MEEKIKNKPYVVVLAGEALAELGLNVGDNPERDANDLIVHGEDDEPYPIGVAGDVVPNMAKYMAHIAEQTPTGRPLEIRLLTAANKDGDLIHQGLEKLKEEFKGTNVTINTDFIQNKGIDAGSYVIFKDDKGKTLEYGDGETPERFKFIGREDGAAANMLDQGFSADAVLNDADLFVTSAIFQGVSKDKQAVVDLIKTASEKGVEAAYSTNLRASVFKFGLEGTSKWRDNAKKWIEKDIAALKGGSIVFTSLADEMALYNEMSEDELKAKSAAEHKTLIKEVVDRIHTLNPNLDQIVVTNGANIGAVYALDKIKQNREKVTEIKKSDDVNPENIKDPTGAGDSFAGSYIFANKALGKSPGHSAKIGSKIAGEVIQLQGGNVDRELLPNMGADIRMKTGKWANGV